MKQYIGTKLIEAEPAPWVSGTYPDGTDYAGVQPADWPIPSDAVVKEGYRVLYPDGYESWSPKDVFEEAYRLADGMSFGLAIEAAKKGKKIARRGWNGKGQYVELATNISYIAPDGAVANPNHKAIGNKALAFCGTSGVQLGWLASQADMLADDWMIVE